MSKRKSNIAEVDYVILPDGMRKILAFRNFRTARECIKVAGDAWKTTYPAMLVDDPIDDFEDECVQLFPAEGQRIDLYVGNTLSRIQLKIVIDLMRAAGFKLGQLIRAKRAERVQTIKI
jgi:hypothetical protein